LRQVLLNLLSNAVKFTEKGEVALKVIGQEQQNGVVNLEFTVRDTGIGIPENAHDKIFQVFTQADGSTTRKYGGTGLGLSICKELVRLMQGEIGFASKPGEGATFWFTVPLELQAAQHERGEGPSDALQGIRALVVDDNETNRQIVNHQIHSWKMRGGTAGNAFEALQLLHKSVEEGDPYRLVILDMQMPEMDGLTLARIIRNDPRLKGLKLVMLTSLGYLPEERSWRDIGIQAYLIKPVKQLRLLEVLLSVFRAERTGGGDIADDKRPAKSERKLRAAKILVAEDNPVNQRVALRQLQKLGFNADTVGNGKEALQALQRIRYDIVLMDCQMPELDGYEATRRIREIEKRQKLGSGDKALRIIAMTANALSGDREECIEAGMNDYISKPVRMEELEAALDRSLAALAEEEQPASQPGPEAADAETPRVNLAVLDGLRDLRDEENEDPLAEFIDLFMQDTPDRIALIESARQEKDWRELERAAHALKGSSGNIGAARLEEICLAIVQKAKLGEDPGREMIQTLKSEFTELAPILLREKQVK
jgi:CheY-like chemotaxis protein/HPt (histidine-containing phosphotransfer) domain-containing protein